MYLGRAVPRRPSSSAGRRSGQLESRNVLDKFECFERGTAPRLLLLDPIPDREPRAALLRPGRMPEVFPSLGRALDALHGEVRP